MPIHALIITLTLLAGNVPQPAAAAPVWRPLHDDGRVVCELGPVQRPSSTTRVAQIRRTFRVPGERAYAVDTLEFDCADGSYRYRAIVIYDRDGMVVNRYHPTDQPLPVPAASYLADALKTVCR